MYKPNLVMLHIGSTGYVHKSKCKVFRVNYMNFNVCLSCSIHDFYVFLFGFFSVMVCVIPLGQCACLIPLETWLCPTALKKRRIIDMVQGLRDVLLCFQNKMEWLCHTQGYTPYCERF